MPFPKRCNLTTAPVQAKRVRNTHTHTNTIVVPAYRDHRNVYIYLTIQVNTIKAHFRNCSVDENTSQPYS